jgi:hypothetical protein
MGGTPPARSTSINARMTFKMHEQPKSKDMERNGAQNGKWYLSGLKKKRE